MEEPSRLIEVDDVRGKHTKQIVCSKCGQKFTKYKGDRKQMNEAFRRHLESNHEASKPREDVNQAAARIVREATHKS